MLCDMVIAIAGAHGQIARRLTRTLVSRGDSVKGLVRNPDHVGDVEEDGAEPVVCDLEQANAEEVARAIAGVDAVVFAAGAGPGSGPDRKATMDRDGAKLLLEAATEARVKRYVIVSSVGAESPPDDDDGMGPYLRAKAEADRAVSDSELDWVIVRPGRLTDDRGTGNVGLSTEPVRGEVSRDDVAAVLAATLHVRGTAGMTLYVNAGDERIDAAVERLAGERDED